MPAKITRILVSIPRADDNGIIAGIIKAAVPVLLLNKVMKIQKSDIKNKIINKGFPNIMFFMNSAIIILKPLASMAEPKERPPPTRISISQSNLPKSFLLNIFKA